MTREEALSKAIMTLIYFQAHFCKSKEAVDNTQAIIDVLEQIEQEPKWIPCSERLPEEDDYKPSYEVSDGAVLWTNEDGLVGEGYYYESTKTWSDIEDNPVSVTAWMPLPPCYEPQERSDKE